MRPVPTFYSRCSIGKFGPSALKGGSASSIAILAYATINSRPNRVRHIFKSGVAK